MRGNFGTIVTVDIGWMYRFISTYVDDGGLLAGIAVSGALTGDVRWCTLTEILDAS